MEVAQKRLKQLFQYLQAFEQQRNPVVRQISEQEWTLWNKDLPQYPSILFGNSENETEAYVLKISRPKLTQAPAPPNEIKEWLLVGWDDYSKEAKVFEVDTEIDRESNEIQIRFDDDPRRVEALNRWSAERDSWASKERPAGEAYKVFERVYALYNRIEREAGRLELVLGDGILSWRFPTGGVFHPILLQRLQLHFDPQIPEFTFQETAQPVELYTALLRINPNLDPKIIAQFRDALEQGEIHPLEHTTTSNFFKALVQRLDPNGQFVAVGGIRGELDAPRLARDPVIFLRSSNPGFARAIELILEDIPSAENAKTPSSLLNIVGVGQDISPVVESTEARLDGGGNEDEDILFNKPANPEQLMIAKRLERYGCVLVQGPPGTGKTHTIANLIGHLLAKGQSVLVTSHTAKALRVLRDKVDPRIQSLCVSVLDNDSESQQQMSVSIGQIAEKLNNDPDVLQKKADETEKSRIEIIETLQALRKNLQQARASEYNDLSVNGLTLSPSSAARNVDEGKGKDDWIPEPTQLGYSLPLSVSEIAELYATNQVISTADENELASALPAPDLAMPANEYTILAQEITASRQSELKDRTDLWRTNNQTSKENLEDLLASLQRAIVTIIESQDEPWKLALINDGHRGETYRKIWEELIDQINEVVQLAAMSRSQVLTYCPRLASDIPLEQQVKTLDEILRHLGKSNNLGWLALRLHSDWKTIIEKSSVNDNHPFESAHFEALKQAAMLEMQRIKLITRWDRQMMPLGAPSATKFNPYPEEVCQQYVSLMQRLLNWQSEVWIPVEQGLQGIGFQWDQFFQEVPLNLEPNGNLLRLVQGVQNQLPPIFQARFIALHRVEIERRWFEYQAKIKSHIAAGQSGALLTELLHAVESLDFATHKQLADRIKELHLRHQSYIRRRELLNRLEPLAKGWANAIRHRISPHDKSVPVGDAEKAWRWKQLNDELAEIGRISTETTQSLIDKKVEDLHRITAEMIDVSSWAHQIRRTSLEQKQALNGWMQTINKIGKGTGKNAPHLLAKARKLMEKCRSAVPVWIMPMNKVVESYQPKRGLFDVVIVDEASQCDVMGLIALYLGKKVIVVGDDQQVSPEAVGKQVVVANNLIDEYLQGIPNAHLYDGKQSIYDLAMQSFSGSICLREHFRCVPEIIQFSNGLSYDWKIKPLRDNTHSPLTPAVISHYVNKAYADSKVNRTEALTVASLVAAAIEQPEYAEQSFGIISLLGDEQAEMIGGILREKISPAEFAKRNISAGNAPQFQGDERDVIFLSVVDSTNGNGPLAMRQDDRFKKRFNVAASRAKNQLWVVHSLQPANDLKSGDLRRRLIEYAQNPQEYLQAEEQYLNRTESEFERQVMKRLLDTGYDITPQWKVGAYRIDMVINGRNRRVALECDGDRWHPVEKIPEDMERQATLERLGWKFIRIRGSEFFRDAEKVMERVMKRLEALGIEPIRTTEFTAQPQSDLKDRVIRRAEQLRIEWDKGHTTSLKTEFFVNEEVESSQDLDESADLRPEIPPTEQSNLFELEVDSKSRNGSSAKLLFTNSETIVMTRDYLGKKQDIEELLYQILPSRGKIEREIVIKKIAQEMGYKNIKRDLRTAINKTLSTMIQNGELQTDYGWQQVWRRA